MEQKQAFQYARLFDSQTGEPADDCERDGLVMGPQTARQFEENMDDCAVTVCCITYKHEGLIRQALDSFLMQKTNFRYKIFVGEDHGPDGTADIVREYARKYPDKVFAFCREKNMGAQRNLVDLCMRANSPYIAFCEGDDYWIDEYKLQKQYDYMQSHPKMRMVLTHTRIEAPQEWHLNGYYAHNGKGEMILPECERSFIVKETYHVGDFMRVFPSHTSSAFFRWNYDLSVPDWYYTGIVGDIPMFAMQMGMGRAAYLPDITSVYRRTEVGVFMNHSTEEFFINTRLDYVRMLNGLEAYFREHHHGAYHAERRERTCREMNNFVNTAMRSGQPELIQGMLEAYPEQSVWLLLEYRRKGDLYRDLENRIGDANAKLILQRRSVPRIVRGSLKGYRTLKRIQTLLNRVLSFCRRMSVRISYWNNALVPKEKNLWVITSFRHRGYMDNSMYFYEYMVEHHPEIRLVWVTTDEAVIEKLTREGKPVVRMDSPEGTKLIAKAAVAITDHFATSDYSPRYGLNAKTKVVQLWHGVGFKSMGDGKNVKNTAEPGVVYSYDILPAKGDSVAVRLIKRIKYWFRAPYRELFERYFMLVCPGRERIEKIGRLWSIPESAYFIAGHPRDIHMYLQSAEQNPQKIMYAPTYRFDAKHENMLIQGVVQNGEEIQALMEKLNAEFYVRLHPHTWRNYGSILHGLETNYSRIHIDNDRDVYTHLGTFSLLITDYSSISLDLAHLDRPVIFYCPDYDWFIEHEAGFGVDFPNVIPGVMTHTWEQTLEQIQLHIEKPETNTALRRERISYFFDPAANGPDNSERIAQEIKCRLDI